MKQYYKQPKNHFYYLKALEKRISARMELREHLTFHPINITHKAYFFPGDTLGQMRFIPTLNKLANLFDCRVVVAKGGIIYGIHLVGKITDIREVIEIMDTIILKGIFISVNKYTDILKARPKSDIHASRLKSNLRGNLNIRFIRVIEAHNYRMDELWKAGLLQYIKETSLRVNRKLHAK